MVVSIKLDIFPTADIKPVPIGIENTFAELSLRISYSHLNNSCLKLRISLCLFSLSKKVLG